MPKSQHKNTNNEEQDMSPLEPSNPIMAGSEYCNIA